MSSQRGHSLIDPAAHSKMPSFESTIASTGLSKTGHVPDYLKNKPLQYSGSYYSCDPRGKDGADFTYAWSNPKTTLLESRSSMSHLPGMEKQKHIVYRPDNSNISTEQGPSLSSPVRHTPSKHGFAYYTRSPEISSPSAAPPLVVRNKTVGGMSLSPPTENSAYLTVPKPYYGHSPCCNDMAYMLGQRYSLEHGRQKMPNMLYDCTGAHYTHLPSPILTKAPETLMQKKGLPLEYNAERLALKDITEEQYHGLSPSRARTLPVYSETNYSNYPCTPTRTLFGPFNEQSQSLQTPRSLHPSHPLIYEHMASVQHGIPSQVYHDHSHLSKYGQLPQLPMFYYPQANMEVQSGAVSKETGLSHREDVVLKHTRSSPQGHYMIPQPIFSEVHMPGPIAPPNHPFLQGFDNLCYPVPRIHLDSSPMRVPLKRLHAPPPSLHSNSSSTSPPSRHVERHSPSKHTDRQRGSPLSPANMHLKRVPYPGLHMGHPSPSTACVNSDEPLDYSQHKSQGHFDGAMFHQSPALHGAQLHRAVTCSASPVQQIRGPYTTVTSTGQHAAPHGVGTTNYFQRNLKRSASYTPPDHTSPLLKITADNRDVLEMEECTKRQKMEVQRLKEQAAYFPDSPPMPVIDNVFSLAPLASGEFHSTKGAVRTGQFSESGAEKPDLCVQEKAAQTEGQQHVVCSVHTEKRFEDGPDIPVKKPALQMLDLKKIKTEERNTQYTDSSEGTHFNRCKLIQDYCKEITVKQEVEEPALSDDEPMLMIKKCEPDEFESKPFISVKHEPSESTAGDLTAEIEVACPTQDETETSPEQKVTSTDPPADQATPLSTTPPQPTENQVKFKNIPPHCLKLSTYNIVLPESLTPMTVRPTAQPDTPLYKLVMTMSKPQSGINQLDCQDFQPEAKPELKRTPELHKYVCQDFQTEAKPKSELHKLVRQHFLELHQSLCKLVSDHVCLSSEQEVKTWLSQLELTAPVSSSTKVQNVTNLLGENVRKVWLNEEIKTALHKVLQRLREYVAQSQCPFPHVMRTGMIFIPMLVVKELMFPQVNGSFIDQVLQLHKVALRPTTLSEEKIIIQLHKSACSSKLRRLLSLKYLPDIYADVINLFYHACVCKHMESTSADAQKRAQGLMLSVAGVELDETTSRERDEGSEAACTPWSLLSSDAGPASQPLSREPQRFQKEQRKISLLNKWKPKGRVRRSSKRTFLDDRTSSSEDEVESTELTRDGRITFQGKESSDSWTRPLTPPNSTETEGISSTLHFSESSGLTKSQTRPKKHSDMILKLRRVQFNKGHGGIKSHYQTVANPGAPSDHSFSEAEGREDARERGSNGNLLRRISSKVTHRWHRTAGFSHTLRPLSSSSKRPRTSLFKIKYCPYLSACHSAEHRRRWVLRSSVQRARWAMKLYPDLVGKRIRHLYEEDDKSEMWYRGEVVRIHEAHPNPLKTVFEVRYDSEPDWKYYLELLLDYTKGWLKIDG